MNRFILGTHAGTVVQSFQEGRQQKGTDTRGLTDFGTHVVSAVGLIFNDGLIFYVGLDPPRDFCYRPVMYECVKRSCLPISCTYLLVNLVVVV